LFIQLQLNSLGRQYVSFKNNQYYNVNFTKPGFLQVLKPFTENVDVIIDNITFVRAINHLDPYSFIDLVVENA
jgi:hypothetical protein